MTVLLTDNLPLLAGAPNGIKKLRELILELAVRGKLVPQDPNDEPASELLKRIAEEKARLVSEGKIRKQKPLAESGEEAEPFELPAGWKWSSLAQVAFVNPRNAAADSLEVSFVPMTFIGTRFDDQHAQEPRLWGEVKQGFTHFAEGDIGVAKITPCFENSKACVFSNLANGLGAGTTELHIVRPVSGTLDPRYVLAYLKSPQFLLVGETKMTGTAGQKRLPKDFVEANPFSLPPLSEQHRIVAKVDELMALCDRLEAQQAGDDSAHAQLVQALLDSLTQARDAEDFAQSWQRLVEHFHTLFISESSIDALKQTLLQLAVMGKLVPQDPSEDTLRASLDRRQERSTKVRRGIPESVSIDEWIKAFPAPNSWGKISTAQLLRAGALIDVKDGNHGANHPVKGDWSEDGLPFITAAQVNNLDIDYSGAKKLSGDPLKRLRVGFSEPGDVIYTHKGSVGRTAVNSQPCVLSPQTTYYRPDSDLIFNRYLMYFFQSAFFTRQVDEVKNQTTRDFVPITQQYLFFILVPPLAEQHRIVAKVDQLMTLCDQLKARLNQARQVHELLASALVEQAVA